jgi:hypothetical protein
MNMKTLYYYYHLSANIPYHCSHRPHRVCRQLAKQPKLLLHGPKKTYNTRDPQMVTHSNRSVQCLCMAERTEYTIVTRLTRGNSAGLSVQFDSRNLFLDKFIT